MLNHEDYIERAAIVKHAFLNQLNKKSLRYNWHDAEVSVLEGVFARGDRKIASVIEEAYHIQMSNVFQNAVFAELNSYFQCRHLLSILPHRIQNTAYGSSVSLRPSWRDPILF